MASPTTSTTSSTTSTSTTSSVVSHNRPVTMTSPTTSTTSSSSSSTQPSRIKTPKVPPQGFLILSLLQGNVRCMTAWRRWEKAWATVPGVPKKPFAKATYVFVSYLSLEERACFSRVSKLGKKIIHIATTRRIVQEGLQERYLGAMICRPSLFYARYSRDPSAVDGRYHHAPFVHTGTTVVSRSRPVISALNNDYLVLSEVQQDRIDVRSLEGRGFQIPLPSHSHAVSLHLRNEQLTYWTVTEGEPRYTVTLYDLPTRRSATWDPDFPPYEGGIGLRATIARKGNTIAIGRDDGRIGVWRLDQTEQGVRIGERSFSQFTPGYYHHVDRPQGRLNSLTFCRPGNGALSVAAGTMDGGMAIWDVRTKTPNIFNMNSKTFPSSLGIRGGQNLFTSGMVSDGENTLYTILDAPSSPRGAIVAWDLRITNRCELVLRGFTNEIPGHEWMVAPQSHHHLSFPWLALPMHTRDERTFRIALVNLAKGELVRMWDTPNFIQALHFDEHTFRAYSSPVVRQPDDPTTRLYRWDCNGLGDWKNRAPLRW